MNEITHLPPELESNIGPEHKDFVVKAKRRNPAKPSISTTLFGILWSSITIFIFIGIFSPLLA